MVFIHDEGSEFNGSLQKVWQLLQSEGKHTHSFQRNLQVTMDGNSPVLSYEVQTPGGQWVKQKIKVSMYPPVGVALEYLDGDMAGTKAVQYYIPKGNKTGITVVGEYVSKSVPADQLKKMVMKNLETVFNEDQENLKKM